MARPTPAARRYAEAAFEVALRDDELDGWRDDLALARDMLARPEVVPVVDSPAIPTADRLGVVDKLLGGRIRPGALRLVSLLVERGRARELARVNDQFQRMLNAHRGIVVATVTSAAPLTDEETAEVRKRVESMADSTVELRTAVDPALLGGLTVQIGDRLLDASIRGRLERLRTQLNSGARPRRAKPGDEPRTRARTETPWPSGQTRSSASSGARSSRSTRRRRPAASGPWSRSATGSPRSTASTRPSRPRCSSSRAG